jgi:hypothetical protein
MARQSTLKERIEAIRDEIDEIIDARVEAQRPQCPGVPAQVLRNLITNRSGGCHCEAALQLATKGELV